MVVAHARVARARGFVLKGFAARLQVGKGLGLPPSSRGDGVWEQSIGRSEPRGRVRDGSKHSIWATSH